MTQLINALGFWNTSATRHAPIEDVQGIFSGSLVAALGLYVLASAGLLTGSTAGVAFLLHYAFGVNFGLAFFLLNLPFFWLSWKRLGMAFTIKTFVAIGLTSVLADVQSRFFSISSIHPAWAALLGSLLLGFGVLGLLYFGREVLVPFAVTLRTLVWVRKPPRGESAGSSTRRMAEPWTPGIP